MRKRTRRKVYQLINPISMAIEGAAVTVGPDLDKLRYVELAAINAFANGQATLAEWHELEALTSIAAVMSQKGIGTEVMSVCMQSKAHLDDTMARFKRIGRMGATGPALVCWRDLYEYHDLQRASISRGQYETLIRETTNRINGGQSLNQLLKDV